jgi:hypothetical protein
MRSCWLVYLLLLPDFGDDLFKLVNVDNLHVGVGGTASRGRRGGLQWVGQVTDWARVLT